MSQIQINNLNFIYPGQTEYIFKNVNLTLDTDWKLGLIGRNGSGKTTLLKLLLGEYESNNAISKNIEFEYFPYEIKNENDLTINIAYKILPNLEEWRLYKELNLIKMDANILYRNFSTLSGGEMIKFLLICAFLKENKFLLIDEPTNHIDEESKDSLIEYLKQKKGFILVSHDRKILNEVVDHILYIGKQNITLEQGTYNSWKFNKTNRDNNEIEQNKRLKNDIMKLDEIAKKTENWSNAVEKSKKGAVDKGHVGHQAAKMKPLIASRKNLILVQNLSIFYDKKILFKNLNFEINSGERVAIEGKNGSGKSSIVKLIVGENIPNNKGLKGMPNLKISYVSQMTDEVKGTISEYARYNNVDEGIFRAMLQKLGVDKEKLDTNLSDLSEGQKKKVMIARSISEDSEIYIWDEPLNYLDIQSREQIENMILKYEPTMLFIEHDNVFINKIATKVIQLPEE